MGKRFGRNQKRAMREQIAPAMAYHLIREQKKRYL